jgi:hypothetical protein
MDGGGVVLLTHPSGMPIDFGSALICSGGTGFGVIGSFYCQRSQPGQGLRDHQNAEST